MVSRTLPSQPQLVSCSMAQKLPIAKVLMVFSTLSKLTELVPLATFPGFLQGFNPKAAYASMFEAMPSMKQSLSSITAMIIPLQRHLNLNLHIAATDL